MNVVNPTNVFFVQETNGDNILLGVMYHQRQIDYYMKLLLSHLTQVKFYPLMKTLQNNL